MIIKTKIYATKIFDNVFVVRRKNKVTLKLNKLAYVGMCIFDLSKVLMYEFHHDYIENKNNSILLFTDTDRCMKLKSRMFMRISVKIKICLILVITELSQNIMMVQTNQLLVR